MSNALPEDFYASVSNWKGTRVIHSSASEILGEAQGVANEVIGRVNSALNVMESSGDRALDEAAAAITDLGNFRPSSIAVNYSPPDFLNPGALEAPSLVLADSTGGGDNPGGNHVLGGDGSGGDGVTVAIDTPPPPVIGGTPPPTPPTVVFGDAPPLQTFFAPPTPALGDIKDTSAPPEVPFVPFEAALPQPPALRELVLPTFTPQPFPDYVDPVTQPLPPLPPTPSISLDGLVDYARLWSDEIINAVPKLGGVLVRDLVTQRDVRNSVETFRLRGCPLDDEQDQIDSTDEITRLMNQAESRQLLIDEGLLGASVSRTQLRFAVQYQVMLLELELAVAKVYFEAQMAQAEAQLSLAKAMTAYYNALIAEYAADADVYKIHIAEEVARMQYWQALVQGEVAKTKANAQMASLYVQTEQVEGIEAEVYTAQIGAVLAQVERYKATIEAMVAKAEVAKTSIAVYRGQTEAYAAGVAAYKAHFDEYAARAKSSSAQNQAEMSAAELSLAEATRAAAEAGIISTNIEVTAEQLKAQAMKVASTYEAAKLTNAIEANRAQIAASSGRIQNLQFTADLQVKEVHLDSASAYASAATRYYAAASDAAFRASEQALKAITAATQAAALAQEAAGRTSAALSQGALSALHISAGLQGAGRLSGSEQHGARLDQNIRDDLNYTESKSIQVNA